MMFTRVFLVFLGLALCSAEALPAQKKKSLMRKEAMILETSGEQQKTLLPVPPLTTTTVEGGSDTQVADLNARCGELDQSKQTRCYELAQEIGPLMDEFEGLFDEASPDNMYHPVTTNDLDNMDDPAKTDDLNNMDYQAPAPGDEDEAGQTLGGGDLDGAGDGVETSSACADCVQAAENAISCWSTSAYSPDETQALVDIWHSAGLDWWQAAMDAVPSSCYVSLQEQGGRLEQQVASRKQTRSKGNCDQCQGCVNPTTDPPASWTCPCRVDMVANCETAADQVACFKGLFCGDGRVTTAWKVTNSCPDTSGCTPALVERSARREKDNVSSLDAEKHNVGSLDESLSGKRCAR